MCSSDLEEARVRGAARAALEKAEKAFGFDLPQGTVVTAGNKEWLARKGDAGAAGAQAMTFLRGANGGQARRGRLRHEGALRLGAPRPAGGGSVSVPLVAR